MARRYIFSPCSSSSSSSLPALTSERDIQPPTLSSSCERAHASSDVGFFFFDIFRLRARARQDKGP